MRFRATSLALLAALLGSLTIGAHADTVTYWFTGGPTFFTGTNFTYVDTAGFLAFDTGELAPTTATDVIAGGTDQGAMTGFEFASGNFSIFTMDTSSTSYLTVPYQIGAATAGEQLLGYGGIDWGTLVITDRPSVSAAPEPSGLVLLGTGVLVLAGVARRRFLKA